MCGFAGIFTTSPDRAVPLGPAVQRMAGTLAHRGPDDTGSWCDEEAGIALGFRRLSILDLSSLGHQPMRSASGRFTLVYNGEVYNESVLRRALEREGFTFRGRSDTEVVLAAFEAWGVRRALERFVGMFALALWDSRDRTLTLARDCVGIKPLFVYAEPGLVTFGSELKALLAGPSFDRSLCPEALDSYLRHLYVPSPGTIYRHARKLPPGHFLTLRRPGRPLPPAEAYWDLESIALQGSGDPFPGTDVEAVDELDRLLGDAVSLQMRSDVPLGAWLSGGVDSSTVVALMQEASSRPVQTFCIGFGAGEHDESLDAARVAARLGTEHTQLQVTGDDALGLVPGLPDLFDEPMADPSQIPTHIVSRLTRGQVTVAMSGDGGDELFGGYNRYVEGVRAIQKAERVPASVRRLVSRGIGAVSASRWDRLHDVASPILPQGLRHRLAGQKLSKIGALFGERDAPSMYVSLLSACRDPSRIMTVRGARADPVEEILGRSYPAALVDRMALADQLWYLPDDLLAKVDRASMATGLEVRVPILDHRVVEFSWSLPPSLKIRNGQGKWILREVLHRRVPPSLVNRPKVGFSVPVESWLGGPLRGWAEDLLGSRRMGGPEGLLDGAAVRRVWNLFLGGRTELGLAVWAVLVFQAWSDRWL